MAIFASPLHTTFNIPTGKGSATTPIHITAQPDIKAENLPLSTWTASVVLARQLHRFDFDFSIPNPPTASHLENDNPSATPPPAPIPILELGAGTGLVGLSAACLWRTRAMLTDLAPIVPNLQANARLNEGVDVHCGALNWATPDSLILSADDDDPAAAERIIPSARSARVILAADVIYDADHPALLAGAIFAWLERSPAARVCVCYPLRVAYLDEIRELWERLEAGGLESVVEGKERFVDVSPNGDDEMLCEWGVWRWGPGMGRL